MYLVTIDKEFSDVIAQYPETGTSFRQKFHQNPLCCVGFSAVTSLQIMNVTCGEVHQ